MNPIELVEDIAGAAVPGVGWVRTAWKVARKVWPYVAIAILAAALQLTRGTLERVKLEHKTELAELGRQSAEADARAARKGEAAAAGYADRLAAREPLIVRSKDTVNTYAQTPAGRTTCLGADRVHGLDELDASLFTPADPARAARALQADAGAPPGGRVGDQR